jgi:hypothetical protein
VRQVIPRPDIRAAWNTALGVGPTWVSGVGARLARLVRVDVQLQRLCSWNLDRMKAPSQSRPALRCSYIVCECHSHPDPAAQPTPKGRRQLHFVPY